MTIDDGCLFAVMLGMTQPLTISTDLDEHNDSFLVLDSSCAITAGIPPTEQLSPKIATLAESPGNYVGPIDSTVRSSVTWVIISFEH